MLFAQFLTLTTVGWLGVVSGNQDALRDATRELQAALNPINATRIRAAAERVATVNSEAAVRALAQVLPALRDEHARVGSTIDEKQTECEEIRARGTVQGNTILLDQSDFQALQDAEAELARLQTTYTAAADAVNHVKNAMRRFTAQEAGEALLDLLGGRDVDVKVAAGQGLVSFPRNVMDDVIIEQVCRGFRGERDDAGKIMMIEILRSRETLTDEVREVLRQGLADASWRVVLTAAQAVRDMDARDLTPNVIEAMEGADGRLLAELNRILTAMTGYDYRRDVDGWRSWWESMGDAFVSGDYTRPEAQEGGGAQTASFFGMPIESRRLIFILDRSGSMETPSSYQRANLTGGGSDVPQGVPSQPAGNRKIDILRHEFALAMHSLPDGTIFNVFAYDDQWEKFSDALVTLNDGTRRQVVAWVNGLEPRGATNIYDPTEGAMEYAPIDAGASRRMRGGIDTIILMSDGFPNHGRITEPSAIRAAIADLNAVRRLRIDTVFLGEPGEEQGADFLESISSENEGRHVRFIN